MDKEALALRNRNLTEAFHSLPVKHYVRRALLHTLAKIPLPALKTDKPNRILLIRPDHLGDVLLTTPAIRALRAALPNTEIHALVGPWSAEVIANYAEIDQVLTLPFPGFSRNNSKDSLGSPYELAVRAARHLRRIGYSSALVLRPDHWWGAMLTHMVGISERIGYDLPDVAPFLTHTIELKREHVVMQNLRLVERWTGSIKPEDTVYSFSTESIDRGYIDGYLHEWGVEPTQSIICIHPGSGTWVKQWQLEKWISVADTLAEQLNAAVVLTGGDHELHLVQHIAGKMTTPACIMAGDTRVGQLAALFTRAKVVLGPDSGPMHLAAAVGTPTVTLFGPADSVEFAPWGSRQKHIVLTTDIACRPCRILDWGSDDPNNHPCVRDISVGQVLEAARRVTSA